MMGQYKEYLNRWKGCQVPLDGSAQLKNINQRLRGERRIRWLEETSFLLLLVGAVAYFNFGYLLFGGVTIADYVFQDKSVDNGALISYVFGE